MNKVLTFILVLILLNHCSIDRTISPLSPQELETLEDFQNLPGESKIQISDDKEPGQKLWLCLRFIEKESKKALSQQEVHLYHTSTNGNYEPSNPNDESTARLSGTLFTNKQGQAFVQTILPGDYGSSADNRHIHTTVFGAKPEAYDIHFKQYTGHMGKNFISGSDQHFLAELKQYQDSTLITFLSIEVKNPRIQD